MGYMVVRILSLLLYGLLLLCIVLVVILNIRLDAPWNLEVVILIYLAPISFLFFLFGAVRHQFELDRFSPNLMFYVIIYGVLFVANWLCVVLFVANFVMVPVVTSIMLTSLYLLSIPLLLSRPSVQQ